MRTPADIRPICLLSLHAKLLAAMLADRHAVAYLEGLPQFAYMPNKQVADALDRVFAHCFRGRQLTSGRWGSVHYRREGLCEPDAQGAFQISLDIEKAYDKVSRAQLESALLEAGVDCDTIALIMSIHDQAKLRVTYQDESADIPTKCGLRQRCGLSPLL